MEPLVSFVIFHSTGTKYRRRKLARPGSAAGGISSVEVLGWGEGRGGALLHFDLGVIIVAFSGARVGALPAGGRGGRLGPPSPCALCRVLRGRLAAPHSFSSSSSELREQRDSSPGPGKRRVSRRRLSCSAAGQAGCGERLRRHTCAAVGGGDATELAVVTRRGPRRKALSAFSSTVGGGGAGQRG